jgi:5-methyltetrahydrofolate--homocysteine methyltransferase
MKRAVGHLEQFLEKKEGYTKGKVVLATVFGDVHDIGKNLVNTILSNNGYTVYDLGKQVPINVILDKAVEVDADAIGLSALLVSTSKQMPLCVQELHKRGLSFPVMVGGAAINRAYGRRILFVEGEPYAPGVFYGRDAFEGLEIMDQLTNPDRRETFVEQICTEAAAARAAAESGGRERPVALARRAAIARDNPIPEPPFWGTWVLPEIEREAIYDCFDLKSLFRLSWGAKNKDGADYERLLQEEFYPWLERLKAEARERGTIAPQAVYGYFPCQSDGDTLLVYDPFDRAAVRERFVFPRQRGVEEPLCLADYFASVDSGRMDVVAFQCVSVGDRATEIKAELQAAGDYSYSYYLHGFATQAAEATAEWLHRRIRRELGLGPNQGRRYSWGYGAIPDLADHEKLFRLLPAAGALDMELTAAHQLVPEESTAAIVLHHPQATYFAMGLTREEQLVGE